MTEKNLGVSDALRNAGYVLIPAWWVLPDELQAIHRMAHKHSFNITAIRLKCRSNIEEIVQGAVET